MRKLNLGKRRVTLRAYAHPNSHTRMSTATSLTHTHTHTHAQATVALYSPSSSSLLLNPKPEADSISWGSCLVLMEMDAVKSPPVTVGIDSDVTFTMTLHCTVVPKFA